MTAAVTLDYHSDTYRDAYSRINGIVIVGEQEAADNYCKIAELLPAHREELLALAKMESRHKKGFEACGRNLNVTPDLTFAQQFFQRLRANFQAAFAAGNVVACLLIQALIIESFAIAAYNIYIPVADPFARKITEGVVKDEYLHLNFGQRWLKEHFAEVKEALKEANRQNLPLVWQMLNEVEQDAATLGMEKAALVEDFLIAYGDALADIGFNTREVMQMTAMGLAAV
ncbi:MAG: aldehyde oxygenase (deformylating) [Gloeomargarita sp. SKYBB_i_bin120]|nr:aldehyde oxygenase (deformylating) [Gloeomargarita sp. SKYG98]MCS7291718.1 aldehyde oxygenase (deformylating) [Gloeomargarita sp. SKYB120]MDW8177277.1 aldehyde oxygenase (deformylating) [Gloeomargarita sp. SKYBB_i_bin120]